MMNRTRKIFAAILLGMTAVFIFGCRRGSIQTPPPAGAQTQPPAAAQSSTAQPGVVPPDDGGGVITFATFSYLMDSYKPILEEFHKQYPSITVQLRDASTIMSTMDPRQIASAADTTLLMYRAANSASYFLDLSPLEQADPTFKPDSFWPGVLDACKDGEGRAYGLPLFGDPTGIYYQEKAFDAAGLPYPQPGWTWEDFQKAASALARTENGLPVYGFADDSFLDSPDETLLSPRISYLLDQTGGEIDAALLTEELQWYLNLAKSGGLYSENIYPQLSPLLDPKNTEAWSKAFNETWKTRHEMFLNHPPAMWKGQLNQHYWGEVDLKALPDGSLNMTSASDWIIRGSKGIGWAPFPVSADGKNDHTTPSMVTCAVISAGTKYPRAAWTWLTFLAAHPPLEEWWIAVPSQLSAVESSGFWGKVPQKYQEAVKFAAEHGWYSNPHPEAVLAANQALIKAVASNADLPAALAEASRQVKGAARPTPDAAPVVVAPPEPTAAPSVTTIHYLSPFSFAGGDRLQKLAEAFHQQHPEIAVEIAPPSWGEGVAGLADANDCFAWLREDNLPADRLYDLDPFLITGDAAVQKDFTPQELEEFSQQGKHFGLPTAYRPNLIYYNADLLTKRGLKPPSVNWTYADFIELISAAVSDGADASDSQADPVYGFALSYTGQDLELLLAGRNVRLVDSSGKVPAYLFDTPETRASVQWLADQVKAGVIFPVTSINIGTHEQNIMDARQLILDGRVALWLSWFDPGQGGYYALQDAKFPIGVAPIPLPGGKSTWRPVQLALGQYISRKAKNPQACWDWIKFLSEQPDNSLGVPARRSVRESAAWVAQVGSEAAQVYQAAVDQQRTLAQQSGYSLGPTRDGWDAVLAEVVNGAYPLPLLAELQGKADAYAACLAASSDYQAGNKAQAVDACAAKMNQK